MKQHEIYAMHEAEAKRLFRNTTLITMYEDYFNNYLTVAVFSEHNNIPVEIGHQVINLGRELRNKVLKK